VIEQVTSFVGGYGAGMFARDAVRHATDLHCSCGVAPHYAQLYAETHARFDPLQTVYHCLDIGDVVSSSSIIPHSEFTETRFYKEWAKPQGLIDSVIALLDKSATSIAALSIVRHERDGFADEAARRRLRLLAPHLRRAVLIGRVIELKSAGAASFADTLDGLGAGLFLVDQDGRVVHANTAGHAMLEAGDVLKTSGERLTATDPQDDQGLRDAVTAAGEGDAAIGVRGIAAPLSARRGEQHVAHVLPLTAGARRRAGANYAATAALFVQKAALSAPSPPEAIAKAYKLTPSELRVLLAVVEVGGAPEVAEALGIAESTVRFHLKRLFEKTGTGRQADLVKLMAGFSSPLRS
jgi:DNA-binding CsgD family transcriptional regulator/PAS domain-containing protein